jgi:hypothetical protein
MDHKALVISMWPVVIALAAGMWECRAEEKPFSSRGLRHGHMFLIWNEAGGAPKITLTSLLFAKYTDGLEFKVISADGKVLTSNEVDAGKKAEISSLPSSPRYLVLAEPGMNGVRLEVDRPWGLVVGPTRPIGPNAPSGRLYFYVPPECKEFKITVCCRSPKEAVKIVVHTPDGAAAGELDGELDEDTPLKVEVPAGGADAVWSVEFLPPTAPGTFLDDVALNLEGELPLLLCPQPDWALKMGKEAWRIDKRQ